MLIKVFIYIYIPAKTPRNGGKKKEKYFTVTFDQIDSVGSLTHLFFIINLLIYYYYYYS